VIEFRVNETASAMLSRAWTDDVLRGLRATMDEQNQLTIGHTRQARLTGKGPFPVSEGRLGVRTNRLRSSLRAAKASITGNSVVSSIGSNVEYAAAHEFGSKIHRTVKPGSVRLRTTAKGDLLRGLTGGAVFAKAKQKRVREVPYAGGKSYTVNIPARAPIAHGIEDRKAEYERAMSQSIIKTLRGLGYS
jgi:phage gpG-like protein